MTRLSVNINKVAVLRNSRGGLLPDPLQAARIALASGCHGITVHPRPDQRHIRAIDVLRLPDVLAGAELNIEGNPFAPARDGYPGLLELVRQTQPEQVTLVPDGGMLTTGVSETKTKTTTQIGSGLNVGNNLTTRSGGDTTFAGTDVTVAGSADLQSGGNINIIARENSVESSTTSTTSGVGVGGGVYGTSKTTTDSLSVRNVGSNFNVGGDAKLDAKNDVTIQGSNVAIGGNAEINATRTWRWSA